MDDFQIVLNATEPSAERQLREQVLDGPDRDRGGIRNPVTLVTDPRGSMFACNRWLALLLCGQSRYHADPELAGRIDAALAAGMRVTELDRHGAINEDALRQWNPDMAKNVRGTLGPWIAGEAISSARVLAATGLVVGLLHPVVLAVVLLATARNRKNGDFSPGLRIIEGG